MEVLDEDIEFVRKALVDASEAAKGWFETIVEQHAEALADNKELRDAAKLYDAKVEELESERDDAKEELKGALDELNDEIQQRDEALETVKYWFLDVLVHGKPMTPPRRIRREVEKALGDA